MHLQVTRVQLQRPRHVPTDRPAQTPWLTLVQAIEVDPPAGERPVHWLILTTLAVPDLAAAAQIIAWYRLRWLIERYHGILKSGLRQEALQLRTADNLHKALTLNALVAARLLWLTYAARLLPDAPCTLAFTTREWQTLHVATQSTPLPTTPPTLAEAVHHLGVLGGHRP